MKYFLVLCFMVFCAAAQSDDADGLSNKVLNQYFKDELNYEAYFSKFKTALLAGDKQRLASLNLYFSAKPAIGMLDTNAEAKLVLEHAKDCSRLSNWKKAKASYCVFRFVVAAICGDVLYFIFEAWLEQ